MILDVCSFLDPRFCAVYLTNKTNTLIRIETEACEVTDQMSNEQSRNPEIQEAIQPAPSKN